MSAAINTPAAANVAQIRHQDLSAAAQDGVITAEQAQALWARW